MRTEALLTLKLKLGSPAAWVTRQGVERSYSNLFSALLCSPEGLMQEVSSIRWALLGWRQGWEGDESGKEREKKSQVDVFGALGLVLFLREGKTHPQHSLETATGLVKTHLY